MSWTTTGLEPVLARGTVPIDESVLNVLSASTYTDQSLLKRHAPKNKQAPLGFVIDESIADNDDDDISTRPRKRVKPSKTTSTKSTEGSDDANKKHRGRPRIEGQDETAVDRRRTQIRLAQRAYRNRKEITITTLKRQNTELQESITRMTDAFKQLHEDLTQSQMLQHHGFAMQHLKTLQSELQHAATLSVVEDQDDVEPTTTKNKKISKPTVDHDLGAIQTSITPSLPMQEQTGSRNSYGFLEENHALQKLPAKSQNVAYPEINVLDLNSNIAQSSYFNWNPELTMSDNIIGAPQDVPSIGFWPADNLALEKSFPQRKSYTYSFQETTFARRLHRMCLERAFRSLTNPDTDPSFLARTFRFTLFYLNKKRLRNGLQSILQRKAGEHLENWEVPYFHIGGAGTHFPRRDAVGKPIFPPNLQSPAKAPGPWQLVDDSDDSVESTSVQAMLDEMGYGGDWFDSHDVDGYLRSKGIYLDGSSSFVEVDTSKIALPADVQSQSTTSSAVPTLAASPSSAHSFPSNPSSGMVAMSGINNVATALNDQLQLLEDPGSDFVPQYHWSSTTMDPTLAAPASPGAVPTFEQVIRRKQGIVTFDVERFLDRVVEGGSCLGRAPGFRKVAVDSALALAVQEAF